MNCPNQYPPTHQYNWRMKPQGPLKERLEIIESNYRLQKFFYGKQFLDVACSFGYFSLNNRKNFQSITGIDVNAESIGWCKKHNKYPHITFQNTSFRDFTSPLGFDKIFVGNVAHHLFLDCDGWSWIPKLYALSENQVLIEGALSTKCKDIEEIIPEKLQAKYNMFSEEMDKYFALIEKVKTTSYTPDRYLLLYSKKAKPQVQLNTLEIKKQIKLEDFRVFKTKNNLIAKVFIRNPASQQVWSGMTRIRLSCESPITNGMVGEIYNGDMMVGWLENDDGNDLYHYFENEKELWNKMCDHNIFLSKNGYMDIDSATINFNKKTGKLFDKSCVFPISKLTNETIDVYPVLFNQSYHLGNHIPQRIVEAAKTRDSKLIEKTFLESKQ